MTNLIQLKENVRSWMDIFTTHSMHAWTRYVRSSGLSMSQFGILMKLYYEHTCGVSDISGQLDVSAAAASQLVEKLVQNGLLERAEDPNDRRAKRLTLTAKGNDLIKNGIDARLSWTDDLVAALKPDEYKVVMAALSALSRAASQIDMKRTDKSTSIGLPGGKTNMENSEE